MVQIQEGFLYRGGFLQVIFYIQRT